MPKTIVVGTDGSDTAERAIDEAIGIAQRDQAALHVVAAFPDPAIIRERITSGSTAASVNLSQVADSVLNRAAMHAEEKGVHAETHSREADPAEAILDVADEVNADLIVVGSRGLSGLRKYLLGSVSTKVASAAHCNVMIIRD
jgi:nucleotide-binding universal stress UspA family protein